MPNPTARSEFTVAGSERYDRSGPFRWILSHLSRHRRFFAGFLGATLIANGLNAVVPWLTGRAFDAVVNDRDRGQLTTIAFALLGVVLVRGVFDLFGRFCVEVMGKRLERDARDELFLSLLVKSQTFHNRQRVGDLMARATNDVRQLNAMITPGVDLLLDSGTNLVIPIVFIGLLDWRLLAAPLLFTLGFGIALRGYTRRLNPVAGAMRAQFGTLNAGLTEAVGGIEVVKSSAQEPRERTKFDTNARAYRDLAVQEGLIQARYLPPLILAVATAGALFHGLSLVDHGELSIGGLITYLGLMGTLRFPAFISIFTFSLVQFGIVSADRILALMREETELDENDAGHRAEIRGEIVFENVSFGYGDEPLLQNVSFRAAPGQTVTIVGQTGSGKSTLTKLVNRTYDVAAGRILIDGRDVRDWSLASLRSQISSIEQDIVLFSRPVAENIGFSLGQRADQAGIERAAKDAQAHDFICELPEGYQTTIGERGVTLSGGQRQRLAIARALLTDPRILILDDSTSAIDSATEDEIQRAIRRVLEGRTTLLITHRLSQIRWADQILVLQRGRLVDQGTHDDLLGRCDLYRRIFARHETVEQVAAGQE